MDGDLTSSDVVLIAQLVFFAGIAWYLLANNKPDWVRVVTGVAAAVVAIAILVGLV